LIILLFDRDLKPRNVLLHEDGHVLLADMGAVADFAGNIFDNKVRKVGSRIDKVTEEDDGEKKEEGEEDEEEVIIERPTEFHEDIQPEQPQSQPQPTTNTNNGSNSNNSNRRRSRRGQGREVEEGRRLPAVRKSIMGWGNEIRWIIKVNILSHINTG